MRMRSLCGAILLLPLFASAQKPPLPGIGESIEVSIVNVDVFVTNKAGEHVRGLTQNDFEIYENGVKQPISNFAEYAGETQGPPSAAQPAPAAPAPAIHPQERTVILFFDRFYLPKFQNDPLFTSIKKLMHDTVRPGDRAMIVTWNRGVLVTVQDFTDSLPKLDRALDGVQTLSGKPLLDRTAETKWMIAFTQSMDDEATAGGISTVGDSLADLELQSVAEREKYDLVHKIRTVNALIRSIAAVEGKKILLLATHRLSRNAGAEHYYAAGKEMVPLEKQGPLDMTPYIKQMEETANANGVTIYPVFPEGLQSTQSDVVGSSVADYRILQNETPTLREIAEETGGMTAWGSGDVGKLLPQVREDLDSYYSLAYRIHDSGADKARKVVVKLKNPSLIVRSRREFMEKSDSTRMEDRVIAALFREPPSPGNVPLHVSMGQRKEKGKQYLIPLSIHIPISALTALQTGNQYAGSFSVYFAWGGKVGGLSDTKHETRTYRIPADQMTKARSQYLTYDVELLADKGTERVAFGVFDDVGKEYALRMVDLRR